MVVSSSYSLFIHKKFNKIKFQFMGIKKQIKAKGAIKLRNILFQTKIIFMLPRRLRHPKTT